MTTKGEKISRRVPGKNLKEGKRLLLTFVQIAIGILFCFCAYSQDSLPAQKTTHQSVELMFDGSINSNAITNDFIKAFYRGEFLDNELKSAVDGGLASVQKFQNRLGGETKTGFTYYHSLSNPGHSFSFSYFDRTHLSLSFSKDLFDMVFYGNEMFAGDTAKLFNFRMNYLHYEQFRFGWKWEGDATHGSYGAAFSLLSGDDNLYINGTSTGLYTAPDGSYLQLPLGMNVFESDTARKKYFSQNGMGVSADIFYELPYLFAKKPGRITFALNDLGFIRWNANSLHYAVDSFYTFSGITVDNLVHLDSNVFSSANTNHLIQSNAKVERAVYQRYIPATLDIHTYTFYGRNFHFEKGFKYYFNTSAFPYFYTKFHFVFRAFRNKNLFHLMYVAGYGGFGKFHSGIELYFESQKYSVALADNYLFSGIAQTSYGMGCYVKLTRKF